MPNLSETPITQEWLEANGFEPRELPFAPGVADLTYTSWSRSWGDVRVTGMWLDRPQPVSFMTNGPQVQISEFRGLFFRLHAFAKHPHFRRLDVDCPKSIQVVIDSYEFIAQEKWPS